MEKINENTVVPYGKTAVILGNFDGLHTAHTAVIKSGIDYAKANNIPCGVLVFTENTKSITEKDGVKLIIDNNEKLRLMENMGVDFVYTVMFDREFMKKTPEKFIYDTVHCLKPKAVFAGYDYRFGYMAEGDTKTLAEFGKKYDFETIITPEICVDGTPVSSTLIRKFIADGDVIRANRLLGRPFAMCGKVEYGLQNGRKMGFPTANLAYDNNMVIPHTGVYAGYTIFDDKKYESVINVGNNPTFNADKITIESNIFDFERDIYGENIRIEFTEKIRGDIKFNDIAELKKQISADAETAKRILRKGSL